MYSQVIKLLCKSKILQISEDLGGERYTKRFNAWIHLVVMLYAVIKRFDSLREITTSLLADTHKLAHIGITFKIGRSTLADANRRRPQAIFENIISAPKRAMTQFVYDCYLNGIKQDSLFTCNTTDRNHIITWSKSTYPKLLMYRDSFATALYQFLAPYFSTSEFLWKDLRNSEKEFILQEKPDLLILEVAERKVTYLLGSDFER